MAGLLLGACDMESDYVDQGDAWEAQEVLSAAFPDDDGDGWLVTNTWTQGPPGCDWGVTGCPGGALAEHDTVWGGEWHEFKLEVEGANIDVYLKEWDGWDLIMSGQANEAGGIDIDAVTRERVL